MSSICSIIPFSDEFYDILRVLNCVKLNDEDSIEMENLIQLSISAITKMIQVTNGKSEIIQLPMENIEHYCTIRKRYDIFIARMNEILMLE